MKKAQKQNQNGFSLMELIIAMTITLMLMAIAATLFSSALSTRSRESRRTDALTSAQAAINVLSREIANAGYGLTYNGIVTADSGSQRLHIRSNFVNTNMITCDPGEDVTYFYDANSSSIVRYDRFPATPTSCATATGETSVVVNRISNVTFQYFDYTGSNSTPTVVTTPTVNTSRVRITVTVQLEPVTGQPNNQTVTFTSDVTLRNSDYMLNQY
ncbi:MAG TPA: prepilin-type N-terminal cleavage/methylation domain-containing protein [Pyrinomonadaceae bacterium]|jgi:prepilin-type N-terminal cleavage/methylation domain-containing protein